MIIVVIVCIISVLVVLTVRSRVLGFRKTPVSLPVSCVQLHWLGQRRLQLVGRELSPRGGLATSYIAAGCQAHGRPRHEPQPATAAN